MHNLAGDLARSGEAQEANHRCDILWLGNGRSRFASGPSRTAAAMPLGPPKADWSRACE